jgi:hypothetical protein
MGSVIISASHVGTSSAFGRGYPGPASLEEMEIAKRAARADKQLWGRDVSL